MPERLADPPREMVVGRPYHDPLARFHDPHHAAERMIPLRLPLLIADHAQQLVATSPDGGTAQAKNPGRIFIRDPATGRTDGLVRTRRTGRPGPFPLAEDRAALGAKGRLRQFASRFIRVVHVLL